MSAPDTNAAQQRAALVLFEAALEQPLAQRDAWLVDACAGDAALLSQVRELLAVDSAHDGFSAEFDDEFGHASELGDATGGAVTTSGPHRWLPVRPPSQIGPYALDELIGSGGMGAVYSARRNDGLFDQTVAIKFVRPLRGAWFGAGAGRRRAAPARAHAASGHRPHPGRWHHRQRPALPGDGVRAGRGTRRRMPVTRGWMHAAAMALLVPVCSGRRPCAPAPRASLRHQAGQHPGHARWPAQAHRLRRGPAAGCARCRAAARLHPRLFESAAPGR